MSKETKHTPGPWGLEKHSLHIMSNDKIICTIWQDTPGFGHPIHRALPVEAADANARLIVAAPEMLKAINGAIKIKELWTIPADACIHPEHQGEACALQDMLHDFEIIIAKVKGEKNGW